MKPSLTALGRLVLLAALIGGASWPLGSHGRHLVAALMIGALVYAVVHTAQGGVASILATGVAAAGS